MKSRFLLGAACLAALLTVSVAVADKNAVNLEGVKCLLNPKGAAKADKTAAFEGGKVFFCCGNCPKTFDGKVGKSEALRAKARAQLIATGQASQGKCPISGGPAKAGTEVVVGGAKVRFCCKNCQGKVAGLSGDKQLITALGDKASKKAKVKVGK